MRETDLARPHTQPAADERGHRGRMMGAAERAGADEAATLKPARDRGDHRYFERLGRSEVGKDARQDRKSVVEGKSVSVRVDLGGRRTIKKKKTTETS